MHLPHVKICGITRRSDALFCVDAGAGALGAVFYKKSPRNVSAAQARRLFDGLPPTSPASASSSTPPSTSC
jgi:phosphoribosylanthranilate isomerase